MKKLEYNSKQVRIFSTILFLLIGFVTYRLTLSRNFTFKAIVFSSEILVLLFIFLKPIIFYPVFRTAMVFSTFLGNIIFKIITTVVFYFILTPIALVMRLFGKKFLTLQKNQNQDTYFEDYVPHAGTEKQY